MSGVKDLLGGEEQNNDQQGSDISQAKSLVANVYSTDGDDKYKDVSGWEWFDSLAWEVTKENGTVRTSLKKLAPSGNHEEWYTRFQIYLAHYIGGVIGNLPELPDGEEPKGAVPLMDFLGFDEQDVAQYVVASEFELSDLNDAIKQARAEQAGNDEDDDSSMSDAAEDAYSDDEEQDDE